MRLTGLGLTTVGVLFLGTAFSYPQIRGTQIKAAHAEAVSRMVKDCRVLPAGQNVAAGFYYAQYLDPAKKWTDANTGKPIVEGALLSGGVAKSICSLGGSAAELGPNGAAQNVRSIPAPDMRKMLRDRYPNGVPPEDMAVMSIVWKPNFEARVKEKAKPREMEIGK